MTQPTPTPEPAVLAAVVVGIVDAVLVLLGTLSVHIPTGFGAALDGVIGALSLAVPIVAGLIVRSKVTPVGPAPVPLAVAAHFDPVKPE